MSGRPARGHRQPEPETTRRPGTCTRPATTSRRSPTRPGPSARGCYHIVAPDVTAIITQNGNAYEDGFVDDFRAPALAYQREQTPTTEAAIRGALDVEAIRWQRAFARDLPGARIHLLPGGHFLLENEVGQVADLIRDFLAELPSNHLTDRNTVAIR